MTIKSDLLLLEAALVSSARENLDAFLAKPFSDLVGYSFDEASTPVELRHAIIGTADDLTQSVKAGDVSVGKDHGINNMGELREFLKFSKQVENNPEEYFNAYQESLSPNTEIEDLETKLPQLGTNDQEAVEDELVSAIGTERYNR